MTNSAPRTLTRVVEHTYTTGEAYVPSRALPMGQRPVMAFVRRKGNAYYLVHNVRRGGKVRQLHLARLGDRIRITDSVVREASRKHPFVQLDWRRLREQLENQIDLADPESPAVQKLVHSLRRLNLDLADLFPPVLRISESPAVAQELLLQLRLLQSTIQIKLDQFRQRGELKSAHRLEGRLGTADPDLRKR